MVKLHKEKIYEVINVGTGISTSINELLSIIENITNKKSKVQYDKLPKGDPDISMGIYNKINKVLNIDIENFKNLNEGLKETFEYLVEE